MTYRNEIVIDERAAVSRVELDGVLDACRANGAAEVVMGRLGPERIVVTWEVGPDDGCPDLWDLRGLHEDLAAELSGHSLSFAHDKPEAVGE